MPGRAASVGRVLWLLIFALPLVSSAQPLLQHHLQVVLQPDTQHLQVTDTLTLPATIGPFWSFFLHDGWSLTSSTPGVRILRQSPASTPSAAVPLAAYEVTLPPSTRTVVLHYAGHLPQALPPPGTEYARSFTDTPGILTTAGAYLQAATFWYPHDQETLLTFTLEVQLPPGWEAISQGQRTRHDTLPTATQVRWESPEPQEQIYLVAGPLTEYRQRSGSVDAMVFLRTPEPALAQPYLEATAQYIAMYSSLIAPYPYVKFALVENFWESGYGMPSFTLLGSTVIRLPFIVHSSYPHEILHNWWGNGVFVDDTGGNWCEGLTAYLADHLLQEQRGSAADYRRTALQKYTDYVTAQQDFPLTAFRARHNAVTEAIGYSKALMFFHMLRQELGDATFIRGLQTFYQTHRFRRAGYDDLLQAFTQAAGRNLQARFAPWLNRSGAPELRLQTAAVRADGDAYLLTAVVEQVQSGAAYALQLPVAVTLEQQGRAYETTVPMSDARLELTLRLPARPLCLDIDPQFDVLRRLHWQELPPALTQMFGARQALILLPTAAPEALRQAYQQLAQHWQQAYAPAIEVRWDNELTTLPDDRALWLWGWENRWSTVLPPALADYQVTLDANSVRLGEVTLQRAAHTVVLTARHPDNPQHTLAWVATSSPAAVPGLGRKLPHYGKYSYLGFRGDEPVNVAKGQWPVLQSPLSLALPPADEPPTQRATPAVRPPLATLPVAFSAGRMLQVIHTLASSTMQGRGFGTPELEQAADFIAAQFRDAGLQPGGSAPESYFQTWVARGGDPEREARLKNVIGILPGRKPEWAGQSVILGAHYDHLGLGWPDVHHGERGMVHPGADDNASGVAILLELARVLGKTWQPERSIVFIAFSGEEAGRLGSQYYVTHAARFPVVQSMAMLNLDTVGRLGAHTLQVLGTASAREWPHIFHGVSYVTGTPVESVAHDWGGSDQRSFIDAGVPAVQFFSGAHADYHRPTDTSDKIDPEGLVKIAAVIRETVVYLAGRAEPLTATIGGQSEARSVSTSGAAVATGRRVSLGTIPDFAYTGQGYRISAVTPASPAAQAGLQAGDIIVQLGSTPIVDLPSFTSILRTLIPGEAVTLIIQRGAAKHTVQIQLAPR
jgi:hypothetical protein